jgi:hypothetical protein
MAKPDVKAKMEAQQKEQEKLRDQEYAMVFKQLDSGQRAAFKKMLGKKFDLDSMRQGFFQRFGQRGGPTPKTAAAKSDPASADTKKTDSTTDATTTAKTTPRRQSLRDRRGLGQQKSTSPPE